MQNSDCKITISCHGYTALFAAVENNRRHNQNHGSRKNKYFFLISRRIILKNHGLRLLMKSRFTRKKQAISWITRIPHPLPSRDDSSKDEMGIIPISSYERFEKILENK